MNDVKCKMHASKLLLVQSQQQRALEKWLKLTIKTSEQRQLRRSGIFIVNFEHISHLFAVFLLLNLSK